MSDTRTTLLKTWGTVTGLWILITIASEYMSNEKSATYQAWADSDGILFTTLEGVAWHKERGLLSAAATLLHEVIADTPEEASAVHHIKMGWAPYKPMGEAAPCPQCGACFYPESSGVCPNCGPIC